MRLVADISVWQTHDTNGNRVAYDLDSFAGAVDAAWVRFTDWIGYARWGPDPDYHHCINRLQDHMKPVGTYLFCRPGMSDPATQIDAWVGHTPTQTWAPMLDLEVNDGMSGSQLTQWTNEALARMTGQFRRIPWLYTQASKVISWGMTKPTVPHLLIVAGYPFGYDPFPWSQRAGWEQRAYGRFGGPDIPPGWDHVDAWQFTSSAEVPGMTGLIDVEFCTEDAYLQSASVGNDFNDLERGVLRSLGVKL